VNFLNVGPWELSVILIIAILLIGPKRLVEVFQAIRRFSGQLRRMSTEFTSLIQSEIQASAHEIDQAHRGPGGEVEEIVKGGLAPLASIQTEIQTAAQEVRQALEDAVHAAQEPIADVEAELPTTAREARQDLESIADSEPQSGEGQNEASNTDPAT
jgi:Sec-independent protein translocase protein TatA